MVQIIEVPIEKCSSVQMLNMLYLDVEIFFILLFGNYIFLFSWFNLRYRIRLFLKNFKNFLDFFLIHHLMFRVSCEYVEYKVNHYIIVPLFKYGLHNFEVCLLIIVQILYRYIKPDNYWVWSIEEAFNKTIS